jgi:N-acetylmuramoyl-L-alanine amidase
MERSERHSDLLGGAGDALESSDEDRYLVRTLIDMTLNETISDSFTLSEKVISEMQKVTKMHKKTPQHASLAVLTAPDIPSILVEVGFISNPTEEKNLNWSKHRERLADSILTAVKRYFKAYPPEGSLWAIQKANIPQDYVVQSGDSLSRIAARFGTTVRALKQKNNLTNNNIRIGQTLSIPVGS